MIKDEGKFTRFPNEIFDFILGSKLTGTQSSIVYTVIRNTYGWGREYCQLSLKDFEKITGCSRAQLARDVKKLINDGMLIEKYEGQDRSLKFNTKIIN